MTELSREYAEALFAIACEEKAEKEYSEALEKISEALRENPEYMDFLLCPGIPATERLSAVEEAFSGFLPENVVFFLQLLCEKGRIQLFEGCVKEYNKLLDASMYISTAKITSAVELTQDEKKRLQSKLEKMIGHSVVMECIIDPSVMGGVLIETEGRVIDGSLRRHLHEVKEVIGR